ncbi:MAG: hypothetical protein V4613_11030 [Bacteroidota bacterium]
MKATIRFIAAHNFLPIINTVICYRYFSVLTGTPTDYFFAFGAAFCCWAFYYLDKINDNKDRDFDATERHFFSENDKIIQWCTGVLLLLLALYNFHTFYITEVGLPLIIFITGIAYLKVADTPNKIAKELVSSLIITTAICIIPIQLSGQYHQAFLIPLFFGMIYCNMLTLGLIDEAYDNQHEFSSMPLKFGSRVTLILFSGIALAILLLAFTVNNLFLLQWTIAFVVIHFILIALRKKADINLLHILSDVCFLIPLLTYL